MFTLTRNCRYYTGTLKVSPERAGILLALAQLMNFVGSPLGAMAESTMLKRMSALRMSKILTVVASMGEAAFAILYGLAPTATTATLAYGAITLASMFQRAWSNYYEIGEQFSSGKSLHLSGLTALAMLIDWRPALPSLNW